MKHLLKFVLIGTLFINFHYNDNPRPFSGAMYDITPPIPPGGGYYQKSNQGESIEFQIDSIKDYRLDINYNHKTQLVDAIKVLQIMSGIREEN